MQDKNNVKSAGKDIRKIPPHQIEYNSVSQYTVHTTCTTNVSAE